MNEAIGVNWFQKKMLLQYSASFIGDDGEAKRDLWKERCTTLLYNPNLDYEKFFDLVCSNHNDNFMPNFAWLIEMSKRCYVKEKHKSAWIHPKIYNPIHKTVFAKDSFPSGTTEEQIIATYEKLNPGVKGWKVVGYG